jgi:phage terminase small subunit
MCKPPLPVDLPKSLKRDVFIITERAFREVIKNIETFNQLAISDINLIEVYCNGVNEAFEAAG